MKIKVAGQWHKLKIIVLVILLAGVALSTAQADDIDVFTSGLSDSTKPNIMFVLDFSGSMKADINDNVPPATGSLSKADILKGAVQNLLDDNADNFNAGLILYDYTSSGVKWPISDLNAYANSIDSTIPQSMSIRSKDVIMSILNNRTIGGGTGTVSAMTEAALYFGAGPVSVGGVDQEDIILFTPQTWDTTTNSYSSGADRSANPVTYLPANAYKPNSSQSGLGYCLDFNESGGTNHCYSDRNTTSCVSIAESTHINAAGISYTIDAHKRCQYPHTDKWDGANYISPITDECQRNFIVLISDGKPTQKWPNSATIEALDASNTTCADLGQSIFADSGSSTMGNCGPEIAKNLYENNQIDDINNSNVTTYTIGFNVAGAGQDFLRELASEGGGEFFSADAPEDLSSALEDIISEILGSNENFSELTIDVNKATFSHGNRVYFPLFKPSLRNTWNGNLKGYFIDGDGLKDINNAVATETDASGTRFTETSQSFWSADVDGNDTALGGASAKIVANTNRTIYTFTQGTPSGQTLAGIGDPNRLLKTGSVAPYALFGVANDEDRDALTTWLHDQPVGDALHTRPVTVKYANTSVVYLMTNHGLIHAIDSTTPIDPTAGDTSGGQELFAFIPPELLPNLKKLSGVESSDSHVYGLDGGMTKWHVDGNNDGIVNESDTVTLIFGMRRGGNNYYALDVTNPNLPKYKWKIEGGSTDFADMAQTWSRMSLISAKNGTSIQKYLVFGGGYEAASLDGAVQRTLSTGNTVYFADSNGDYVWHATHVDMDYSIASDITPIDSNSDGVADRIYVGDTGGQVWRIDFPDMAGTKTVTKLADFGDSSFQPFFYPPSISLDNSTSVPYISVAMGSGNRTNPLTLNTQNRLFMLKDKFVNTAVAANTSVINTTSLYNATDNSIGSADSTVANAALASLNSKEGWYINLAVGEKSLSKLLTFEGRVLATTFSPIGTSASTDTCGAIPTTTGRYYAMRLRDAQPIKPLGDDSTPSPTVLNPTHRYMTVSTLGIASPPVVVFPKDSGSVQIVVDKQTVETVDQRLDRLMWHPKQ